MTDLLSGLVVAVSRAPVGTQTAAEALAGATVLVLDDAIDMSPTGGQVTINGVVTDYTESNDDEDSITLAVPLAATLPEGAEVLPYPERVAATALVLVDGSSDPIPATIPWDKQDSLPVGVREEQNREQVRLTRDGEWSWAVFDLPEQPLVRSSAFLDVPTVKLHLAANSAAIPNVTWTRVTGWSTITLNDFDAPTVAGWQPVRESGRHLVVGSHNWVPNSTGVRRVRLVRLGTDGVTETVLRITAEAPNEGGFAAGQVVDSYFLEAGQAVALDVYQSSGAGLALQGDAAGVSTGLLLVRMST